jgi:hypothetical protein
MCTTLNHLFGVVLVITGIVFHALHVGIPHSTHLPKHVASMWYQCGKYVCVANRAAWHEDWCTLPHRWTSRKGTEISYHALLWHSVARAEPLRCLNPIERSSSTMPLTGALLQNSMHSKAASNWWMTFQHEWIHWLQHNTRYETNWSHELKFQFRSAVN